MTAKMNVRRWVFISAAITGILAILTWQLSIGSNQKIAPRPGCQTLLDNDDGSVIAVGVGSGDNHVSHSRDIPKGAKAARIQGVPIDIDSLKRSSIVAIHLHGRQYDDIDIQDLSSFDQLEELCLYETSVSSKGIEALGALPGLKTLWLIGPGIGKESEDAIRRLRHLQILKIGGTGLSLPADWEGRRVCYYSY
jgi:hypothetical protein